jgi:hypothetical protein
MRCGLLSLVVITIYSIIVVPAVPEISTSQSLPSEILVIDPTLSPATIAPIAEPAANGFL